MFAVGVDVANGRSMVAVLDGMRNIVAKPFEVVHTAQGFATLVEKSIAHQELPGQHQCPQGEDGQGGRAKNRAICS